MATRTTRTKDEEIGQVIDGIRYITREEGEKILDHMARERLGMSGEEFLRRYRDGDLEGYEHSDVTMVRMLVPFTE
jgi:hypothetical protein